MTAGRAGTSCVVGAEGAAICAAVCAAVCAGDGTLVRPGARGFDADGEGEARVNRGSDIGSVAAHPGPSTSICGVDAAPGCPSAGRRAAIPPRREPGFRWARNGGGMSLSFMPNRRYQAGCAMPQRANHPDRAHTLSPALALGLSSGGRQAAKSSARRVLFVACGLPGVGIQAQKAPTRRGCRGAPVVRREAREAPAPAGACPGSRRR